MALPHLEEVLPPPAPGRGDPHRCRALAQRYNQFRSEVEAAATQANRALEPLDQLNARAVSALVTGLRTGPLPLLRELVGAAEVAHTGLMRYADALQDFAARAAQITGEVGASLYRIGVLQRELWVLSPTRQTRGRLTHWNIPPSGPPPMADPSAAARWAELCAEWHRRGADIERGQRSWAQLQDERRRTDQHFQHTLRTHRIGRAVADWGRNVAAETFRATAAGRVWSAHQALTLLTLAPTPAAVGALWAGLDPVVRSTLLTGPNSEFLGTLDGIPLPDRHRANLTTLRRDWNATRARQERARLRRAEGIPDDPEERAWEALQQLAEDFLDGDSLALVPPVFLLSYRPSGRRATGIGWRTPPPLASIAVGNLNTAPKAVWVVPGMNSSTEQYRAPVLTLRQLQREVPDAAFVYWLGSDAPGLAQEPSTALATAGGTRLAQELQGIRAAREAAGRPVELHIIGHSYGTTTAATALSRGAPHVASFTLLSSAGLPTDVPSVRALSVDPDRVTAMTATDDAIAPIGKGQRWPLPSDHDVDPHAPDFGARAVPTDAAPGSTLTAPRGHDLFSPRTSPSLRIDANPNTALRTEPEHRHMLSANTTTRAEVVRILSEPSTDRSPSRQ